MTHVEPGSRARTGEATVVARTVARESPLLSGRPPAPPSIDPAPRRYERAPARDADNGPRELGSAAKPPWWKFWADDVSTAGPTRPPLDEMSRQVGDVAIRTRRDRAWDPALPLSEGRNAHHTNTRQEMEDALRHPDDFNWLEGDLRLDDAGTPVMAHDSDQEGDGLTLAQWLDIGRQGERGMKVDVKESDSIPKLLDALEASGIEDGRIMVNVGAGVSDAQLREVRRRFPGAWIALNPGSESGKYEDSDVDRALEAARLVGGNVAFPLRWDLATDEVIGRLRQEGKVSIWTSSGNTPRDRREETRKLRERGVDGIIDLGPSSGLIERLGTSFRDGLVTAFGNEDPVEGAKAIFREQVGDLKDPRMLAVLPLWPVVVPGKLAWQHGGDALRGAASFGGDALGFARDTASKVPVVGGLFD